MCPNLSHKRFRLFLKPLLPSLYRQQLDFENKFSKIVVFSFVLLPQLSFNLSQRSNLGLYEKKRAWREIQCVDHGYVQPGFATTQRMPFYP
jgi:hypothetical protein